MKSQYDYDIIKDYLNGILDRKTSLEIGELIRKDEIARSIAQGILLMDREFKGNDSDVETYLENFRQQQLKRIAQHTGPKKLTEKAWFRVAASMLILVTAGFAIRMALQPSLNSLVSKELSEAYPVSNLFRSGGDATAADKGYESYSSGDYARASIYFEQAAAKEGENTSITFYNALSNLYLGNYSKAVELLEDKSIVESRYAQQARWYQSLALIKSGNIDQATEILTAIKNNGQHFKHEAAVELLDQLK